MSQNSIIAFGLLVGYIVFITMRGELQLYLQVLGLAAPGTGNAGPYLTASAGPQTYSDFLNSPLMQPGPVTPPFVAGPLPLPPGN